MKIIWQELRKLVNEETDVACGRDMTLYVIHRYDPVRITWDTISILLLEKMYSKHPDRSLFCLPDSLTKFDW